jgi:hypothetical protein
MVDPSRPQFGTRARVARIILAGTLLFGILASALPLTTIASGPMCTLACCASRAPHAAGSCMNGSCHANLLIRSKPTHSHHQLLAPESERLCGLPRLTARMSPSSLRVVAMARSTQGSRNDTQDQANLSASTIGKRCQPDCGSCASGFANPNRQRNPAALAYAIRPRPPSSIRLADVEASLTRKLSALCRQCAPRAPPLSFS